MKTRTAVILILLAFSAYFSAKFTFFPQNSTQADTYSKVRIMVNSAEDIALLADNEIDLDHYQGSVKDGIVLVMSQHEVAKLKQTGIPHTVLVPDMTTYYDNRPAPDANAMMKSAEIMQNDNVMSFSYGSMGGYYTYAEVVQKLDSMRLQYPNLITAKQNRGTSTEGRTIWSVKISDNPDVNESGSESVIYFDALHHAREPQAMAGTMYFMYWLLDNYNTNPEAKYLVDNREIYFVPVVNPDGYVYNQTTNPNGGGSWRKNRRNNSGSYGVDLNRNYDYGWGYNSGSSGTPSSDTYRGPSAGSEPETQAIKNMCASILPKIGFSVHSVAGRYLNTLSYNDSAISYDIYSDFSGDFASENNFTYGTVIEMLQYYSSGTTRDWMHRVNGTYCWTPEVGGSDFWPLQNEIIPEANKMLPSYKYLSWVGGAYARFQNYTIQGSGYVERNDTLKLQVGIRNKGLSLPSNSVTVSITTSYPNITAINSNISYGSISARQIKYNTAPFTFKLNNAAAYMDEIKLIVSTKQDNVETSLDTISVIVGRGNVMVSDNSENGTGRWTKSGNQTQWDTSFVGYWSEGHSFADSRYGNSKDNTNNFFTLNDTINLTGAVNPRLEFMAKWATETTFDYTRIQVSTNFGSSWTNLAGRFTSTVGGQPSYHGVQSWIYERVNLNPYIGQRIRLRFNYVSDNGLPGDGFYFDNFRVVNYTDGPVGITQSGNEVPLRFGLSQNYPNPFNPATKIKFDLARSTFVKISVYDVAGREISVPVYQNMSAGSYEMEYDAGNLPSGVYFYRIEAAEFTSIKKMVLVK
ncbi:MAG: immune inhibitor A [Ignavibacteria bacterium]|nr:immune inhibitor A [Ignavibacteria bacterium]